jgi:hypothetical protein
VARRLGRVLRLAAGCAVVLVDDHAAAGPALEVELPLAAIAGAEDGRPLAGAMVELRASRGGLRARLLRQTPVTATELAEADAWAAAVLAHAAPPAGGQDDD